MDSEANLVLADVTHFGRFAIIGDADITTPAAPSDITACGERLPEPLICESEPSYEIGGMSPLRV